MDISLNQQIEEIGRELEWRKKVYPRLVASAKMRESIGDYRCDCLRAAQATLVWLQAQENLIKQRLA